MTERGGMWICVDGTEGTGKTTLTQELIGRLDAVPINEFSDAPFGNALREAVQTSPHFISESPLGQSLVFLGDFIELYDSKIVPALLCGKTVITDRGWLTKYTYQRSVLEQSAHRSQADALLLHVLGMIPPPDLTILLTAPISVVRTRLLERDGHCDDARIDFIKKASEAAFAFLKTEPVLEWREIPTDRTVHDVVHDALDAIATTADRVQLQLEFASAQAPRASGVDAGDGAAL